MEYNFADPHLVVFGKLLLASILGMLIGTERAIIGKNAGTRTFALVALGACLFVIISTNVTNSYLGIVNFDPMRVAAAIVTGVGFLGAGLIIFHDAALRGLTTAAGLWVSAAVGVAVGYGMYEIAIFTGVLTIVIFTALWFFESYVKHIFRHREPVVVVDPDAVQHTDE